MKKIIGCSFILAALLFGLSLSSFADDTVELKWKLPVGAKYVYDFKYDTIYPKNIPNMPETRTSMGGPITIACNGIKANVKWENNYYESILLGKALPPEVLNSMKQTVEDTMDIEGEMKNLLNMYFPLPPEPLKKNKPVEQEKEAISSGYKFKGKAVYNYQEAISFQGMDCVKYHFSFEGQPSDVNGYPGKASLIADYDCVFAPDRGIFISVNGKETVKKELPSKNQSRHVFMEENHTTSIQLKSAEYNQDKAKE